MGIAKNAVISANIAQFHDERLATSGWRFETIPASREIWHWIETNHYFNKQLWDEEDLARRRNVSDGDIAKNKRNIDTFNQKRNDAVERMDDLMLQSLAASTNARAPLHSETAGMMIDRLSILSLKINAMTIQTVRTNVDALHRQSCVEKLGKLKEQRDDLVSCLDLLLKECELGTRRYKIYRQFKMYNDPTLNPQIYGEKAKSEQ